MTADDRRRIREARDAAIRAQRLERIQAGDLDTCSGCGCDTDLRTSGCKTCGDRHRKWKAQQDDPSWYERQRERARQRYAEDAEYRARRQAQQKRRRSGQTATA